MTPTGNPQNILVASLSGMAYLDFLRALFPVAFLGLALQVGLLALLYPETRSLRPLPPPPPLRYRLHPGLLRKGLLVASGLLLAFLLGYPMAQGPWWRQGFSSSPGGSARSGTSCGWTGSFW